MPSANVPSNELARIKPAAALAIAGGLVAWGALSLAGYWQQQQWPAAAIPFGLNRVLVVHLLCLFPLALWCGRWLTVLTGTSQMTVIVAVLAGLVLAGASLLVAPAVPTLLAEDASRGERHALRLLWIGLLLLPWTIAASAVYLRDRPPRPRRQREGLLAAVDGVIATLFAVLAVIHIQQLSGRREALLTHSVVNQHYVSALQIAHQLLELGNVQIGERPARDVAEHLSALVEQSREWIETPLPPDASLDERLERVRHLHRLERFDEIERVLSGFDDKPQAVRRLALASEGRHDYAQAAERYGRTIQLLGDGDLNQEQLELLRFSMERRVNNLRRIGLTREAEEELLAGLQRWPQAQDALLMQLGFHYQLAGRNGEAIEYFQQAAQINPNLQPQVDATLEMLQLQAEGCLLRPARGVTR